MAGFLKRIFSFGKKEVEETPPEEDKTSPEGLPRPDDTEIDATPSPDPDAHAEAAAGTVADAEAGATPQDAPGIEPVPEIARQLAEEREEAAPEPEDSTTEEEPAAETKPTEPRADERSPTPPEELEPEEEPAPSPEAGSVPGEPELAAQEPDIAPREEAARPAEPAVDEPAEEEAAPVAAPEAEPEPEPTPEPEPESEPKRDTPTQPVEPTRPEPEPTPAPPAKSPTPPEPERERPSGKVRIGDEPATVEEAPAEQPKSWFARLSTGLSRSSRQLSDNISGVFTKRQLDEDTLQDLEDVLIQADLGIETAMRITDTLSEGRYGKDVTGDEVRKILADEVSKVLGPVAKPLELDLSHSPHVILVVGVNGTGKTTTIGKLAAKLRDAGLKVTLGAGDTFRAAAIEQLKIWADRTGSTFVGTKLGADAAGLAWDAYEKAKANGSDVVIIDTAGRLQNKAELMDELAKIVRVLQKHDPDAPHTVLQTLDATTGQNALNQVEIFRNVAGVNGLVMTKLDGTARGGILVAISAKYKLPVYFIGVGEGVDDLEPFRASDFASAISGVTA